MGKFFSLDVFLSDCTLENEPDLLRSTVKAGVIGRSLAIYRVDRVIIYRGKRGGDCVRLGRRLRDLLRYMVTPPYLKRKLIPRSPELRYAGLLPPLQIDTHIVSNPPAPGEVRLGIVKKKTRGKLTVDVGLRESVEVYVDSRGAMEFKGLIPLKYTGEGWRILRRSDAYLGYEVIYDENRDIVSLLSGYEGLRVGTSRLGANLWEALDELTSRLRASKAVGVAFGEPYRGLKEIVEEFGGTVGEVFDLYLNFIPEQGTRTVRVEEALTAVLQTIMLLSHAYRSI